MTRRGTRWLIVAVIAASAAGWLIAPHDPYLTHLTMPSQPPGPLLFGSDTLGRDLFSRVLHGGPRTLLTGGGAALVALGLGGVLGASAASGPRFARGIAALVIYALLVLPVIMIALVVVTGLGATLPSAAMAAGIAQAGLAGQVWRGLVAAIRREPYIDGAVAAGAGRWRILRSYVIPNVMPVLLAYGCTLFASSILLTSGLSFLGVGGDPASPDWGNMIAEGRQAIRYAPWILLAPAASLVIVTASLSAAARILAGRTES
jgi:peptide/nickel transport system permease protein